MAVSFFAIEIIVSFLLAGGILYSYGKIQRQTLPILTVVLISWYFSLLIVTILPNDISATVYRQCKNKLLPPVINETIVTQAPVIYETSSIYDHPLGIEYSANLDDVEGYSPRRRREIYHPNNDCIEPPSYVDKSVVSIKLLYRIVYWTTQILTWFLIPFLSAYVQTGEFTVLQKAKTALIDNAIYYGTYVLIFVILLVYVSISTTYDLSFSNLKLIGISAANTWGLFLLVLLLGYGLVEIPRSFWYRSDINHQIDRDYFNLAKITEEKHEATEDLESILCEVNKISDNTRFSHPLRRFVNVICKKCPPDFQDTLCKTDYHEYNDANVPTERTLIRLHKRLNKSLQRSQRTETQFNLFLKRALFYEDVIKNTNSKEKIWKVYYSADDSSWQWVPLTIKWWWRCSLRSHLMKTVSVIFAGLSCMVVWSECTFWVKKPTLSIFALIVQYSSAKHNYFNLEVFCIFIISYLCFCAYSTLFQIKLFNIYYIAPNHQTDNYSLLFIGMFLCRLTPPLCLNFLGLIHMDSHITGIENDEKIDVAYTELMGHLDLVSDGFNIYFPIMILLLCMGTWFKVGTRCLASIGFAQFLQSDELTGDLIEEGKLLVNREKRRFEREWKREQGNWDRTNNYTARREAATPKNEERVSLLKDSNETDENENWSSNSLRNERRPNRSLFDDV